MNAKEIVKAVEAGTHRVVTYGCKRGTRYVIQKLDPSANAWGHASAHASSIKAAIKHLNGEFVVSIQCMVYNKVK